MLGALKFLAGSYQQVLIQFSYKTIVVKKGEIAGSFAKKITYVIRKVIKTHYHSYLDFSSSTGCIKKN